MNDIIYEAVTSLPTDAVVALYTQAGRWKESPKARAQIPALIRGSFIFMVARNRDGQVIGMGRVISDGISDGYIQDVTVDKAWRGHGIGAEITRRPTKLSQERGLGWIGLIAVPGAQEFYQRLGFGPMKDHQPMLFGNEIESI